MRHPYQHECFQYHVLDSARVQTRVRRQSWKPFWLWMMCAHRSGTRRARQGSQNSECPVEDAEFRCH